MTIPPHATLVFKGQVFSVYQWEQEMFDGTMAIFETITRPDTIQIIPTIGDKILLAEEEQPMESRSLSFLGGRAEEGEDSLVTAKRELLEESGLSSDDWELYKMYEAKGKIQWKTYLFIARNCRKVAEPTLDNGEKIEVKEVSFDEFLSVVFAEDFWNQTIANDLFRMKEDGEKLASFKEKLFAKSEI